MSFFSCFNLVKTLIYNKYESYCQFPYDVGFLFIYDDNVISSENVFLWSDLSWNFANMRPHFSPISLNMNTLPGSILFWPVIFDLQFNVLTSGQQPKIQIDLFRFDLTTSASTLNEVSITIIACLRVTKDDLSSMTTYPRLQSFLRPTEHVYKIPIEL